MFKSFPTRQLKGHFYDQKWHLFSTPTSQSVVYKFSPADLSQKMWEFPRSRDATALTEAAVQSAQKGFEKWRRTSLEERVAGLKRYQQALLKRQTEIAEVLAWEVGKPLWEAKTEAQALSSKIDVTIQDSWPRVAPQKYENIMPKVDGTSFPKPLGPIVIIGPFNFPCHLANGQIVAALLTGNSLIFKPSEKTVLSSQLMMECLVEADFPEGVVNFVVGEGDVAQTLTTHPAIRGIFFTGSRAVGKAILRATHQDLKKCVALELGGKNATIVHHDAHLAHVYPELLRACYLTAGQRCTSTALIFVHEKILHEVTEDFSNLVKKIKVGHPFESENPPFMGPLISEDAVAGYLKFCQLGVEQGARELVPTQKLKIDNLTGYYVSPSLHIWDKPQAHLSFFQEEIFGPTACIVPYKTIEEAIVLANSTEYGLASAVFTRDQNVWQRCRQDLEAGLINLNRSTVGASAKLPFGGVKDSGNHRPAAVSMIDHCVHEVACLETTDDTSSSLNDIVGLMK